MIYNCLMRPTKYQLLLPLLFFARHCIIIFIYSFFSCCWYSTFLRFLLLRCWSASLLSGREWRERQKEKKAKHREYRQRHTSEQIIITVHWMEWSPAAAPPSVIHRFSIVGARNGSQKKAKIDKPVTNFPPVVIKLAASLWTVSLPGQHNQKQAASCA